MSDRESSSPGARPTGGIEVDLGALKPIGRQLEQVHARARIGERLFGTSPQPVTLDRFSVIDRIGRGSMGVVYSAYDPQLDRRVAVKVLVPGVLGSSQVARGRLLLREARALARLSHPNVVAIHDVGVIDDQVYIVMEFVVGHDLRSWMEAETRSWREILAVYAQAGRGLAAAHAAGLVHRDFKPENALVGEDGRVRVLDFGLVRGRCGDLPRGDGAAEPGVGLPMLVRADVLRADLDQPLTATGTIMGTPAYMPPEQLTCARVGPASDQFSFCVALYEALYGRRPFAGHTVAELRDNLLAGRIREPPRSTRVPGWVLPVVRRGLAVEPDRRHPSMPALLAALGRDPTHGRRRWMAAMTALAALAVIWAALCSHAGSPAIAPCSGPGPEIEDRWNPEQTAAVRAAVVDTGHPHAEGARSHVDQALQTCWRARTDMHTDACGARRRGHQSDAMLERWMTRWRRLSGWSRPIRASTHGAWWRAHSGVPGPGNPRLLAAHRWMDHTEESR